MRFLCEKMAYYKKSIHLGIISLNRNGLYSKKTEKKLELISKTGDITTLIHSYLTIWNFTKKEYLCAHKN